LGAGLGARGAGAGGTTTAGPLQGALQDGLSSPEVGVAVRKAEHGDHTFQTAPFIDTSTVQSRPGYEGATRALVSPRTERVNGNDSHVVLCGAPSLILLMGWTLDPTPGSSR